MPHAHPSSWNGSIFAKAFDALLEIAKQMSAAALLD